MNWLIATITGLLTGVLGLFSVGFLGSLCVSWYRISGREGASGYYVIALAILGAMVGFVVGLIATYGMSPDHTVLGFFKTLGSSCGAMMVLTAIATGLCWMFADIAPTIDGRELMVEVELRLPAGDTPPPVSNNGKSFLGLYRVANNKQSNSWPGELDLAKAREVDGRWIIPGAVHLFTRRGWRLIHVGLEGKTAQSFSLDFPGSPGKKFEQWSDWLPRMASKDQPWQDSKLSYRFRIQQIQPAVPGPTEEELSAQRFAGLQPETPLKQWLEFINDETVPERKPAVVATAGSRQPELAKLITGSDAEARERALNAVVLLREPSPEIKEAVLAESREIAAGVRGFNGMKLDDPRFYDVQIELRGRFNTWKQAWWNVFHVLNLDGRPPVQEIFDLATVRAQGTSMDEIVLNARVILETLDQPATANTP
jgi:hypothetical protein